MLDTNILVDFFLIYSKEDKKQVIPEYLKRSKELLTLYENARFFNFMSYWNKWELRDVVMEKIFQQKCVSSGFSPNEFSDAKKWIILSKDELKRVNDAVFDIWKYSRRETKDIKKGDYREIELLTKEGFTFMDILLLIQAKKSGCDYFITKERKLKESKMLAKVIGVKIIGIQESLGLFTPR